MKNKPRVDLHSLQLLLLALTAAIIKGVGVTTPTGPAFTTQATVHLLVRISQCSDNSTAKVQATLQ